MIGGGGAAAGELLLDPAAEFAAGYVHPGLTGPRERAARPLGRDRGRAGGGAAGRARVGDGSPCDGADDEPSELVLVRHGATEWSENGRHTSHTDLPLLPAGRNAPGRWRRSLAGHTFARVLSSPLQRARQTAELAGFGDRLEITPGLTEWDYGDYEGLTSQQIHASDPDWSLWHDGCPGGESPARGYGAGRPGDRRCRDGRRRRADVRPRPHPALAGGTLDGTRVAVGGHLALSPATISVLGHEHETRVIERWNAGSVTRGRG